VWFVGVKTFLVYQLGGETSNKGIFRSRHIKKGKVRIIERDVGDDT
jgi:hypothetical protein